MVKKVDPVGLRIARLAYVMHYSLGTQAHMMRTRRLNVRLCARLEKSFGVRYARRPRRTREDRGRGVRYARTIVSALHVS